jgi:hypothetical protein
MNTDENWQVFSLKEKESKMKRIGFKVKIYTLIIISLLFSTCAMQTPLPSELSQDEIKDFVEIRHDKMENITWYKIRNYQFRRVDLYMGEKDDNQWLLLKCSITSTDWLFIDTIIFMTEAEEKYKTTFKNRDRKSEASGGSVKEWVHIPVKKSCNSKFCITIDYLEKIGSSEKTTVRFSGKYYKDIELTEGEMRSIGYMIKYYESIK